jgi:3-deoxy-D-manno-octulosonic-acid transferase
VRAPLRIGYELIAQLARAAAAVAPPRESKIARALHARRGIRRRFREWGQTHRDPARPLVWMHAPSVGEGLQARPVLELMRRDRPDVQLAYTHFSPSAAAFARGLDVDFRDYLPFDTAGDARVALDALAPNALVFAKLDVWPVLTAAAHERGIRVGLISATLAVGSSRRSALAAALLRDAYASLDAIGAIDEADAGRLVELGAREAVIRITGDTRYDQVWERAQRVDRDSTLLRGLLSSRTTLVAGSTWPSDEQALLPAFAALRAGGVDARLIIAPHEPTSTHLTPIEQWADRERMSLARLGAATAYTDVVLVDRVGVLGDLYALADIAFVGGGFHAAGLHSVLEPAAFGAPVLFGPRNGQSRDAQLLVERGGGASGSDTSALVATLRAWIDGEPLRRSVGERARKTVQSGLGAARRSFDLVTGLLR